jgi:GDP-L-fucose synthase
MSKVLITGGSGLVGSHLKEILPNATYISSKDYDLTSESAVNSLFSERWTHVIHLAARVGGILENINFPAEFIEENLLMNTLLLKYARLNSVKNFTAILSTCIYPQSYSKYPMDESAIHVGSPEITNFAYAIAKRTIAVQIDAYRKQYGMEYNYLIPCNLYGEFDRIDDKKSHFVTALINKIIVAEKSGERMVNLLGTGSPLRQFMYAGDLAAVIKYCIENGITESFNVANNENLTIKEIAEIAVKACEVDLEIEFDGISPDGQYRKDVSNTKMLSIIPDFEFTPLAKGIRKVFDRYKFERT